MELIALKQIYLVLLGVAVVIGLISLKKAMKKILRMLLVPIALVIGWYLIQQIWHNLSPTQQFLTVVFGVLCLLGYLLFGTRFGRDVLISIIGNFLYDLLPLAARNIHWILCGLIVVGLLVSFLL